MNNKILKWLFVFLVFLPCVLVMSACCAFKDEKGFKIVINNKSFSAAEDNELVLDVGTVVDYSLVVILDEDVEKSVDKTGLTIVDEDNIIGTAPSAGTYEISIKYADFPAVVIKIIIQKINIAIPTVTTASFIYNNEAQTLELAGFVSSKMNITKNSATKVGSYTAVISLKDKDNYCWIDGTTEDIEIEWSIEEFGLAITLTRPLEKEYDGLAINNPRYSVNADVPVSHAFYTYVEDEWQGIERADIIEAGKYKIVIVTEADDNYINTTKTEEFFVCYDFTKLKIGLVENVANIYTGLVIKPSIYVSIGKDE